MFVPIVPVLPHTTVVNKTIVYSDTVLPVKDLGGNLKVSTVSDVSEYSLERCLKIIFESNPDVIFNTIQYSKQNKKIYFYTNEEISTKAWEDSKVNTYKPITESSEILEELKKILVSKPNKETDCVSLYDVACLIKIKYNEYEKTKHSFDELFDRMLEEKYGSSSRIYFSDFDYQKNELKVEFKYFDRFKKIIFAKCEDYLFVKKDESYWGQEILVLLGDYLLKLYDQLLQYGDFKTQNNYYVKPVNSNFLVDMNCYGISFFAQRSVGFELEMKSYKTEYEYRCNCSTIINVLKGQEDELFKKIFVRIEDCPKWSQPILYEIRQKELAEEKRLEEELQRKEEKKQKRLEFTRKIFPFLK